eukprot:1160443-Pelagomonas_calceolata.AAC.6
MDVQRCKANPASCVRSHTHTFTHTHTPENPAWPNPLKLVIPGRPAPVSALPLVEASPCPRGSALLLVLLPNDVEPGPRKVAMPGLPLPVSTTGTTIKFWA